MAVLVLLVAVASGTVLTALAGARRGASAMERLQEDTLPAHAAILANTPNFDWRPVERLPGVAAVGFFGPSFPVEGRPEVYAGPMLGDSAMATIERPVVLDGRMFDRGRVDEAVVGAALLEQQHLRLGDELSVVLPTPAELPTAAETEDYTGPRLTVRIVGVITSPWWGDATSVYLSPAVAVRYAPNVARAGDTPPGGLFYANALVRLDGGYAATARLRAQFAAATKRSDVEIIDLSDWRDRQPVQQASFEARCLLAFGAAAFLAALFLLGPVLARSAAAATAELEPLRAVGLTGGQSVAAAAAAPAVAGLAGAVVGAGAAAVASRWFPIGLARWMEPAPGFAPDWLVLGPGLAATALLVAGGAAVAGRLALAATRRAAPGRRSGVATAAARLRLPVPVVVGTRFALEPGRGRTAVPVRPALVGAVAGVLGLLAALTFARGVSDVSGHPEKFGQTFDLVAWAGDGDRAVGPVDRLMAALAAEPSVRGAVDERSAVATGGDGRSSVSLFSYSAGPKPLPTVVTAGRMPATADEVLLAPRSLRTLAARVGDTVTLTGNRQRTLTVTGTGLVPAGPHNTYSDGGWLTGAGYDALFDGWKFRMVLVAAEPGAADRINAALARDPALAPFVFAPPEPLREVTALEEVKLLPVLLGGFLALLAVGAVGHALATAVRRREHDLAVLRAMGLTRRQCRWITATQAVVIGLIGLAFGVPLGVAVGRLIWQAVASSTPFEYDPPVALLALLLVGPAALVVVNLLAAWPGHRAARLRIASVLRAD